MKTKKEVPIKVCVCVCPLTKDEENNNLGVNVSLGDEREIKVSMGKDKGEKTYEVDFEPYFFGNNTDNSSPLKQLCECFNGIIIENAFSGYNTTVFTYGAVATGKSTILNGTPKKSGVITNVLEGLFDKADTYDVKTSFQCEISFFELCSDLITDLISKRSNVKSQEGTGKLKVRDDADKGVFVEKISRHIVTDRDEATSLYTKGLKSRQRMAALDPDSKRTSNTMLSITFTMACLKDDLPMELISKINFIDLASEDGYSGFINSLQTGVIPLTDEELLRDDKPGPLETLNDVIKELAAQNYGSINPMRSFTNMSHARPKIPYEDSNLTWLMKDCLGGNCETIMVCCVSPCERNLRQTLNTMKYGNLARHINNKVTVNEDQNVKLIRELKDEIETLKTKSSLAKDKKKIQRDQDLMNRLTGMWETKWSKAQQMIEDKSLDMKDLGQGLKLETKEPHFVSLGGGRLSVGVSIIPIKKGFTRIGSGGEGSEVDLLVKGKGIASVHCLIEYDGEAVVLHPKNELVSVDGLPLSEPTRLPQGCMVCIGRCNYFRFNHPREAAKIKEQCHLSRFSIVPNDVYPDVQLAIEQRRKEMLEKEHLQTENKRLLAIEEQYKSSLDRLALEKDQLEHEKGKLQVLQQQQQNVAKQFDMRMSIQIEELKLQKEELQTIHIEKDNIKEKERAIEEAAKKLENERTEKEQLRKKERERILSEQASLELEEFESLEKSIENVDDEKHRLAMLELDILTDDLEYHDQFQKQKEEILKEKRMLEEMEKQHTHLISKLSYEIERLQLEREGELRKINQEKERLRVLEVEQTKAIETIEHERLKLMQSRESEKEKFDAELVRLEEAESERMRILQNAVDEQERERDIITREKMRLIDLEEEHKRAVVELQQDMLSQQEKMERERQLELEYIEAEQLMLEELEQKQFESARQIEHETQVIREQVEKERTNEKARIESIETYISDMKRKQEETLKQAEEDRAKIQQKQLLEQQQLAQEREKLLRLEKQYNDYSRKLQEERERLRAQFQREKDEEIARIKEQYNNNTSPASSPLQLKPLTADFDANLLIRRRTPEGKLQQIEEERNRLSELKRSAAEKAELEWNEKKKEMERKEIEAREMASKKEMLETLKVEQQMKVAEERRSIFEETERMRKQEQLLKQREAELAELYKEREKREELEKLLESEKEHEQSLERSLSEEKERLNNLEKSFEQEKFKRETIEKRLQEEEERNKSIMLEKKKSSPETLSSAASSDGTTPNGNGTLKRRLPSYQTLSVRSGGREPHEEMNLIQHINDLGHLVDNCPVVRMNRYSCRGHLLKMGQRFTMSWKKRWFVFDRKLRALCYYQDERKTKSKGILYFQSIQEVYVDASIKRSPNTKTTFCVKTPLRTYVLSAPTPIAMSIWIDVIMTGREGAMMSMTL